MLKIIYHLSKTTGEISYATEVKAILGQSKDALKDCPNSWYELIHPEDKYRLHQTIESVTQHEAREIEYRVKNPKGKWRWVSESLREITQDENKKIVLGLISKISKKKKKLVKRKPQKHPWESAITTSEDGIWDWNLQNNYVFYSPRWQEIIGYSQGEIKETINEWINRLHPEDCQRAIAKLNSYLNREIINYEDEYRLITKDRDYRWILAGGQGIWDQKGKAIRFICTNRDITDRKQREIQRSKSWKNLQEEYCQTELLANLIDYLQICNETSEAISLIESHLVRLFPDSCGAIFLFNKSYPEIIASWGNFSLSDTCSSLNNCVCLGQDESYSSQEKCSAMICKQISSNNLELTYCIPMIALGEMIGVFSVIFAQIEELTREKQQYLIKLTKRLTIAILNFKMREKLTNESVRDSLTGLYNRRYLEESLVSQLVEAKSQQQPLVVMMLDVDYFKYYNDTFGHDAGDAILKKLGEFLSHSIRKEDIACRYGGEEFTLTLPGVSLEEGIKIGERIRLGVKEVRVNQGKQAFYAISISIGLACFPEDGQTISQLIQAADKALYQAKETGRNRLVTAQSLPPYTPTPLRRNQPL